MKSAVVLFLFTLSFGVLVPWVAAQADDPRQQGPIMIEKCQTISQSGSYQLANNLKFTGGGNDSCLTITANSVSINLAGFAITGPSFGAAIIAMPPSNQTPLSGIIVRNGSISDIRTGVGLINVTVGPIVEGLSIFGGSDVAANIDGMGIDAVGIIRNNTVYGFNSGIAGGGLITGNYVSTGGSGITVGAGSSVIGNVLISLENAVFANCPSNITNNTATFSSIANITLGGAGCNTTNNVVGP
jgi:hypothetical protein